ncbi:MAG: hypothetical protein AABY83_00200 [Pseudomonadota bacterium]
MNTAPLIIYVPGKNPKPPEDVHQALLWRALVEGVRRYDGATAPTLIAASEFQICAWNVVFYAQTRDPAPGMADFERAMHSAAPSARDRREAKNWHVRLHRAFYTLADHLPWLIPLVPNATLQATIAEIHRYFANYRGIACEVREVLKALLRPCLAQGRQVLIIGHSLGAVIAYDTLWELTWEEQRQGKVDLLTLGSPLGMHFMQRRLQGCRERRDRRYPQLIDRWHNVAAKGDLVALDATVNDDFVYMLRKHMLTEIVDYTGEIYNHFRDGDTLNVHRSYGYLLNPVVGGIVARWWRSAASGVNLMSDNAVAMVSVPC